MGPRFGMERCGKINCENSAAESWTGMGVVAGFADVMGMMESSHRKKAESVSCIRSFHTLQDMRVIGKTCNHVCVMKMGLDHQGSILIRLSFPHVLC